MRQKIGQLLIIGLQGKSLSNEEANFIVKNNIGGIILFDRNLENPNQIHNLCSEIQNLRHKMINKAPLFISIDMEGGRVHRLKSPFTKWPPMQKIGNINSASIAFDLAHQMGLELKAFGINLNFAPCLDILTNPENTIIGDRAISSDAEKVSRLSSALVRGFIKAEVIPCAKHFPGHGNTFLDSHLDLPEEDSGFDILDKRELLPFKKCFRSKLDLIMTAHIKFKMIDPEWPVTLSEIFLKQILCQKLKYTQLIITDDLDMQALTKHYDRSFIPVRALQAGAHILLYCNDPTSHVLAIDAIEKAVQDGGLSSSLIQDHHSKILKFKAERIKQISPLNLTQAMEVLNTACHKETARVVSLG